jgi:alanine racemase
VDLDALGANWRTLRGRVAPRPVYAVVKADAYGHGATLVARRLAREGADRFAVANVEEGAELRRAGIEGEVLVLSRAEPHELARLSAYGLSPALYDLEQARGFAEATMRRGHGALAVHVELDTGMGRAGLRPEVLDSAIAALRGAAGIVVAGVFANLSCADDPASSATPRQLALLREGAARFSAAGLGPGLVHAANSAAVLGPSEAWLDAVRPGLALYGVPPSASDASTQLRPVMSVETDVVSVRRVPAGTPLGYGGRFVTSRDSAIAVLPIGYRDGFRRAFSGRVSVLADGGAAPVVGAVSMDVTLVDATGLGVARGSRMTCLGSRGGANITAWDLAAAADTIPYEILCGFGPRVARVPREVGEA